MSNALASINDIDSRLVVELASEISPIAEILARYGITADELKTKLTDPRFKQAFVEAKRTWSSDLSVKERIRLKSAVLVEDSLLELYAIFHDKDIAAPSRLESFKSLAKVATVFETDKSVGPVGERVQVTFNIGGEKPVVIEGDYSVEREAITDGA